jgi:NO-binding membrane sensor protein with MHYT domain
VAGLVCFVTALTAINLFRRSRTEFRQVRPAWIAAAGAMIGCGIWSTHFIAVLAYEPGVPVAFGIGATALSLLAAMVITAIGLAVAAGTAKWSAHAGGTIVGAGFAFMHYLGMWALDVPGHIAWSTHLVMASIVLGMLFGMASMTVAIRFDEVTSSITAAVLLTLAIVSHHFTAMGAAQVVPNPGRVINEFSLSPLSLTIAIAGTTLGLRAMTLAGTFVDRWRTDNARFTTDERTGGPPRPDRGRDRGLP